MAYYIVTDTQAKNGDKPTRHLVNRGEVMPLSIPQLKATDVGREVWHTDPDCAPDDPEEKPDPRSQQIADELGFE